MNKLPIDDHLDTIVRMVDGNLILKAPPGSGKTTRLPLALLNQTKESILILVPRRLAARLAAEHVAELLGEKVGNTVGYQFRMEHVPGKRITFITEGILLRMLRSNPTLQGIGIVILDEFHERHQQTDIALASLRMLKSQSRPDLKLIVMSATLDTQELETYLQPAKVYEFNTNSHPVEISYNPKWNMSQAVTQAAEKSLGSLLVFLPGIAEIRKLQNEISITSHEIFPLHGSLTKEEQQQALLPQNKPKIILATNIAESSLTIDGVTAVVDSGFHRRASHSWWSGIPTLQTRKISRASAIQRAGRAGRTAPGICIRLFSEEDFKTRPDFDPPEIQRADLSQAFLELLDLGLSPADPNLWLSPPSSDLIKTALELLTLLGAYQNQKLSPLGQKMAQLPLHPRLSRFLIAAGGTKEAALIAAYMSEGALPTRDVLDILSVKPPFAIQKVADLYLRLLKEKPPSLDTHEQIRRGLFLAYPDRVGKIKAGKDKFSEVIFCREGSGLIERSALHHDDIYVIALDVQETTKDSRTQVHVKTHLSLSLENLLEGPLLSESESLEWDAKTKSVVTIKQLNYGKLVLEESKQASPASPEAQRIFFAQILQIEAITVDNISAVISKMTQITGSERLASFLSRMNLMQPEKEGVVSFLNHNPYISVHDLESLPHRIDPKARASMDALLPEQIKLGNRTLPVHYEWGQKPWIESRLQDFFGLKDGPRIMKGKIPLTIRLLAPNKRPAQITSDLAGFWKSSYQEVRKELFRRYPKHKWPINPGGEN